MIDTDNTVAGEVIRDLLGAYPLSATVYPEVGYCGSWSLNTSGSKRCAFHFVARGLCWLHLQHGPPMRLDTGDLVMFPRDASHLLSGRATPLAMTSTVETARDVSITCGFFEFADSRSNPILDSLPDIVVVHARAEVDTRRIADLTAVLAAEARAAPCDRMVLDKLAEVLFAMVLRAHLESGDEKRGFIAALADRRLGRALAAIHAEPERDWRIDTLAQLAHMSRTAFARGFPEHVGMPPMQYVAALRMRRAAMLLRDPRNSVGAIAARLGYRSEAAFRRAFKRLEGSGPGALRRSSAAKGGHALLTPRGR